MRKLYVKFPIHLKGIEPSREIPIQNVLERLTPQHWEYWRSRD